MTFEAQMLAGLLNLLLWCDICSTLLYKLFIQCTEQKERITVAKFESFAKSLMLFCWYGGKFSPVCYPLAKNLIRWVLIHWDIQFFRWHFTNYKYVCTFNRSFISFENICSIWYGPEMLAVQYNQHYSVLFIVKYNNHIEIYMRKFQ